jgi:hypothetical protein
MRLASLPVSHLELQLNKRDLDAKRDMIIEELSNDIVRKFKVTDGTTCMGRNFVGQVLVFVCMGNQYNNQIVLRQAPIDNNGNECSGHYSTTIDKVEEVFDQ